MKRFWISWEQITKDYRPLQDPPQPENVKAWWKSGEAADGSFSTLCAIVDAKHESAAETAIHQGWEANPGEIGELRFCEEKPSDWLPNDRFPITKDWEKERLGI